MRGKSSLNIWKISKSVLCSPSVYRCDPALGKHNLFCCASINQIWTGLDFPFSVRLTLQWNDHKVWGFRTSIKVSEANYDDLCSAYNCTGLTPPWPRRRAILFVRDMLRPLPCICSGDGFILQQDNESEHNSKLCKNYLNIKAGQGVRTVMDFPPQSPDHNLTPNIYGVTWRPSTLWRHKKPCFNTVKSRWDSTSQ